MTLLDANVVLRYLLDDIAEQSHEAARIIESGPVLIPHEVVAEVVYVLSGVYEIRRQDIALALQRLFASNTVKTSDGNVLRSAIEHFAKSNLDFVDCLLFAYAAHGAKAMTFDKELGKAIETLPASE